MKKKVIKGIDNMGGRPEQKIVIYQVLPRLFGNTNSANKPWGTFRENGAGKFNDFTDRALTAIRNLGITHIWYTGVLHHATVTGYAAQGIPGDDPNVVKGRAGSPYAVKDYYNVDPDLAVNPAKRLEEFEALVSRTHRHGMKVIIDIVPNHVARGYHSLTNPAGVEDFGASDDPSHAYRRDNNFYYIPGEAFRVPEWENGYRVLGGEEHTGSYPGFHEYPAKWTGNGSRNPQPQMHDWYETVKINFGVQPDGTHDFDALPDGFDQEPCSTHLKFWQEREVPDSWKKFRDIVHYWLKKGVDGFRYDMAEMVPVEFWSYLNCTIKQERPGAFLLAEIYQPHIYRDFIYKGKMDYLYDKVQLYDSLKNIMQGNGSTDVIVQIADELSDIEQHMLHFLENHDEQRIASPEFAGNACRGMPAMVVSATIGTGPTLIYFGQHAGEPGAEKAGYGEPSRTSIYDYIGVPHHQRWMNGGKFDGGKLSDDEKALHNFYSSLLNFTIRSKALTGNYREIHSYNRTHTAWYNDRLFSFVRWRDEERLIIVSNFDATGTFGFELQLPDDLVRTWNLSTGIYTLEDQLGIHTLHGQPGNRSQKEAPGNRPGTRTVERRTLELHVIDGMAVTRVDIGPLDALILQVRP